MTTLSDGTIVTDFEAHTLNLSLVESGYSIRHIETWHEHDNQSFIHWEPPEISDADLPF